PAALAVAFAEDAAQRVAAAEPPASEVRRQAKAPAARGAEALPANLAEAGPHSAKAPAVLAALAAAADSAAGPEPDPVSIEVRGADVEIADRAIGIHHPAGLGPRRQGIERALLERLYHVGARA